MFLSRYLDQHFGDYEFNDRLGLFGNDVMTIDVFFKRCFLSWLSFNPIHLLKDFTKHTELHQIVLTSIKAHF
jgi:hypothetical protein